MKILALDIEGTLISNAVSIFPRNYLYKFLEYVNTKFDRIVIMTCLEQRKFREVANILCKNYEAPSWFENLEYIHWKIFQTIDWYSSQPEFYKSLKFINEDISNSWIIEDMGKYICPGEESQWIPIKSFERPYKKDKEFKRIMKIL